jgi:hypothetical protein
MVTHVDFKLALPPKMVAEDLAQNVSKLELGKEFMTAMQARGFIGDLVGPPIAMTAFDRCNAAAAASSVAATADSAGDSVACLGLVGANQTGCTAASSATMLAAHHSICAVRSACIAVGEPPVSATPTGQVHSGETPTCHTSNIGPRTVFGMP